MSFSTLNSNGENFSSEIAKNLALELQKLSADCNVQTAIGILSTFWDTGTLVAIPPEDQEQLVQMLDDIEKSINDNQIWAFDIVKTFLRTSLKNIPEQAEREKKLQEREIGRRRQLDIIMRNESERWIFWPVPLNENDDIDEFKKWFPDTIIPLIAQKLFEELAMWPSQYVLNNSGIYHKYIQRAKYVFEKLQEYLKEGAIKWHMTPRPGYEDVDDPRIMQCAELYQFLTGKYDSNDEPLFLSHLKGENYRLILHES